MQNIIKALSTVQIYIILGFAYSLVTVSFFIPLAYLLDSDTFYPSVNLFTISQRFISGNFFKIFLLPIMLYPYFFTVILLLLSIERLRARLILLFTRIEDRFNKRKVQNYLLIFAKRTISFFISYLPITVNLFIYIGFYLMPIKPFLISALGVVMLSSMLLLSFYLRRKRRIAKDICSKAMYISLEYAYQNIIYCTMAVIIMSSKDIKVLSTAYLTLFGFILLLVGLTAMLYKSKELSLR